MNILNPNYLHFSQAFQNFPTVNLCVIHLQQPKMNNRLVHEIGCRVLSLLEALSLYKHVNTQWHWQHILLHSL